MICLNFGQAREPRAGKGLRERSIVSVARLQKTLSCSDLCARVKGMVSCGGMRPERISAMTEPLELPPSISVGPTGVDVSVFTSEGAVVQIVLPRPGGLYALPEHEIVDKARELATAALRSAADALAH